MGIKSLFSIMTVASLVFGQVGLTDKTWRVTTLNRTSVGTMTYTINFKANDSAASGKIDCNSCGWRYKTNGKSITITGGFCTDMACPEESRAGEYEAALLGATTYTIKNSNLVLMKGADTTTVFIDEASRVNELTGKLWQLQSIMQASGTTTITTPDKYTILFDTDTSVSIMTACNECFSIYTLTNGPVSSAGSLSFVPPWCTKVYCGATEVLFKSILRNVAQYWISGDKLYFYANTDTLVFNQKTSGLRPDGFHSASGGIESGYLVMVSKNSLSVTGLGNNVVGIRLFDLHGACVRQGIAINGFSLLNTQGLSRGIYFLQVRIFGRPPVTIPLHLAK